MRIATIFILTIFAFTANSNELPKNFYGQYAGEMESYNVVKNDIEMTVNSHDIKITITEQTIIYKSGRLIVKGRYKFIKQSNGDYMISANLTNGKSLNFVLEFVLNKRNGFMMLNGKNGEPDMSLERLA